MHPDDYHSRFKIRHKLTASDWGVLQHSLALRCVALAGCIDQLDLPNLAIVEVLFREAQMAEYYYRMIERDDLEKSRLAKMAGDRGLGVDEVEYFQGSEKTAYDTMIAPDLIEWISKQGEWYNSIQMDMRNAREKRDLARQYRRSLGVLGLLVEPATSVPFHNCHGATSEAPAGAPPQCPATL